MENFDKQKSLSLSKLDLSRKGLFDEHILDLILYINKLENYFTTSSCSGRIILFDDSLPNDQHSSQSPEVIVPEPETKQTTSIAKKKGCKWLYTSHDFADYQQVLESSLAVTGDAVFKFEPFVLHVQCRTLEHAQTLLSCAVGAGFRNSGISIGNKGKFIVYLQYLVELANKKLAENFQRINRFFQNVKDSVESCSKMERCQGKSDKRSKKLKTKNVNLDSSASNQTANFSAEKNNLVEDMDLTSSNLFDMLDAT
ncbi:hypothetical protein FSP39_007023 [Pinctada imbricata]|uniref:tRNA wybutosine-synthesizing protein 3 homolog n=1 Tax=Pinctada imbricata TaxID=66713 RepID=A0AA88XSV1_PINIB|nr:hypothetical protein FSP39_007023 [Pinctada imbricata]